MLIKLLSQSKLLFKPLALLPVYTFCSEQQFLQAQNQDDLDRAANFYRNSVRRINVDAQGRGKFTEHHLIRLTKLVQKESQVPLLFEAYYNYMGHFTVFSNSTVDKMLLKAMSFSQVPLNLVLEVFENHNYLSYFPHYRVTERFIELAVERDHIIFQKLVRAFLFSPLIKFDQAIVDKLVSLLSVPSSPKGNVSSISKVLMQRSLFGLIDKQISQSQILAAVSSTIQSRQDDQTFKQINPNQYVLKFFNKVKESNPSAEDTQHLEFLQSVFSKTTQNENESVPKNNQEQ